MDDAIQKVMAEKERLINEEKSFVRAWYDPETRGYRFYMPNGEEIKPCMECSVTINDNWKAGLHDYQSAVINVLVKVVNEMPTL